MTESSDNPRSTREWIKHFLIYGLSVVSMNVLSFLLIPIYTRRIMPLEYGVLELLNRAQDIVGIAVMSGLSIAALAFYQFEVEAPQRQRLVFSTAAFGAVINGLALMALTLPFASNISTLLFNTEEYTWAVAIFLPLIPLEVIFRLGLTSYQSQFQSSTYLAVTIGRFAIGLILNLVLVLWLGMGLKGILIATAAHTSIPALVMLVLILRKASWGWEWSLWKEMLRYGAPFIPGGIFLFVLNSGDRYLLNLFHGAAETGIYALSYKLGSVLILALLTPFLKIWGSAMITVTNSEAGTHKVANILTHLVTVYIYSGLVFCLCVPFILQWLAGPLYQAAHHTVPVITLAYLFWCISVVGDTVFYVTKKTAVKPLILGAACVLCIALYLILIPPYGAMGAAWATVASFGFFAALTLRVGNKYLYVPYQYRRLTFVTVAGVSFYLLGRFMITAEVFHPVVPAVLATVFFPLLLWIFGMWTTEEKSYMSRQLNSNWATLVGLFRPAPR